MRTQPGIGGAIVPGHRAHVRRLGALLVARRLGPLASWYGTDKGPHGHGYTRHYQRHLKVRRRESLTLLEIGVGGQNTDSGGPSLRMWRTFFPRAQVIGIDLYEKDLPVERRITVLRGDQGDPEFLEVLASEHGPFDVVIDDGSHRGDHITTAFTCLWKHMAPGGMYVIEDLETAYEGEYGGGPPGAAGTSMSLLKGLLDSVQGHVSPKVAEVAEVAAVFVYPNIAFVEKL